ncbi:MAG: nucleotidyltransferase domain-containing protein [Bacilli bacterium]|nr:nucleotidyltransferase domain-containing protein [Bacilli bacterium]
MIDKKIINYVNKLINKLDLKDYIGVIVYGSYVGGRNNLLSDLDVMIIKDNYQTQDCGSIMIENVRIEYFIQDLKMLYELIKKEIENNDPSHLTKFATCEILYDTNKKTEEFINYAKELYQIKIKSSFDDNDKFAIFSINNRMEDLETLIEDEIFYAVYYITLEKIRTLYSKVNGIIDLPIMKIEKIYDDKNFAKKYIASSSHNLPNQEFIDLYLECIKLDDRDKMFYNLKRLYNYSFDNLDFDPKCFCLKFKKKSPFRV